MTNAREKAREVLAAVRAGAKLDDALSRYVYADRTNPGDRAYAAVLVKTVVRNMNLLDYQIDSNAKEGVRSVHVRLLDILRVAAAEVLLTRTADYAAVNEAVSAAHASFGKISGGFVNAILRRISATAVPVLPDGQDEAYYLSVKYSHPDWLVKRWLARFGRAECERLLAVNNTDAPLYVVYNPLKVTRCEAAAAIRAAGAEVETGPMETLQVELRGAAISDVPPFADGRVLIVDPSSTVGVRVLAPSAGSTVLDMCAGTGGKSWQLAWAVGPGGRVITADNSSRKVKLLAYGRRRFGVDNVLPVVADLTRPLVRDAGFILLDAPCSNTGVLRRKPDVRWRIKEDELFGHAALQMTLLSEAARALPPGGKVVYQTCSTEPEENELVVEAVLAAFPELRLKAPEGDILKPYRDGPYLRTWPHRENLNGAFVAFLEKTGSDRRKR